MAYTTETTIVTGTTIQSSWANTYVRDNVEWLATNAPCCRVFNSVDFSHNSSGSYLAVTFDSERFDTASMHSTVSNTSRITIPASSTGKYIVGGNISFAANATGERRCGSRQNGTTFISLDAQPTASGASATELNPNTVYAFTAADYAELMAFQNSGGTLAVSFGANYSPEFWAFWFRN